MASVIDICNLALTHLGDDATIASISPPEGSAQAEHCARFYPIARNSLLEAHEWNFATVRTSLAMLRDGIPDWPYTYALPSNVLRIIAVLPPNSRTPQNYERTTTEAGTQVVCTDQPDARIKYIRTVTDPTKFSTLFTTALSWHLAASLAGPVLKGEAGATAAQRCTAVTQALLSKAAVVDSQQQHTQNRPFRWNR